MKKIIEKISKLLELANHDTANVHEGQSAMLMAQKLMAKHGIEMADVDGHDKVSKKVINQPVTPMQRTVWWKKQLGVIISENFRCEVFLSSKDGKSQVKFFGLKDDVEIAKDVYQYAVQHIVHTADLAVKEEIREYGGVDKTFRNDFYFGYMDGLKAKFKEQIDADKEMAIILVKDDLVVREFEKLKLGKDRRRQIRTTGDSEARLKGYVAGKSCEPNLKQIE